MVQLFENHIPGASEILDIGGGWGFYDQPLRRRGHHLTVIDVVKPGLQRSPVVIYDGGTLPFPDKAFDVSMFITVLHHIGDLDHVFREALRVTRRSVVVIEDVYHHRLGRVWTVLRDQLYNFEFFGHPKNFKTREEWLSFFRGHGLSLRHYAQVYTKLAGMRILNGIFVLDCGGAS